MIRQNIKQDHMTCKLCINVFNDKILWQTVRDGRLYVFIYLKMGGSRHSRAQTT